MHYTDEAQHSYFQKLLQPFGIGLILIIPLLLLLKVSQRIPFGCRFAVLSKSITIAVKDISELGSGLKIEKAPLCGAGYAKTPKIKILGARYYGI